MRQRFLQIPKRQRRGRRSKTLKPSTAWVPRLFRAASNFAACVLAAKHKQGDEVPSATRRLISRQEGSYGMGLNVSAAGTYKRVRRTPLIGSGVPTINSGGESTKAADTGGPNGAWIQFGELRRLSPNITWPAWPRVERFLRADSIFRIPSSFGMRAVSSMTWFAIGDYGTHRPRRGLSHPT